MTEYYMTKEIMDYIQSVRPPDPTFRWKLKENEWGIWILVSKAELARFGMKKQLEISEYLTDICNTLRQRKIPCYIGEWKEDE